MKLSELSHDFNSVLWLGKCQYFRPVIRYQPQPAIYPSVCSLTVRVCAVSERSWSRHQAVSGAGGEGESERSSEAGESAIAG